MQRCIADFDNTNNKLIVPKRNFKKFPFQERPANCSKHYLLRFWRRGAGLNELKSSMALFLITAVKRIRKIFSRLSKIKIRVISKQPPDSNIYERQSQIGLCIIIYEPKKTLKYSLFFVENHETRSLRIKKKIRWFCDGKNYGKLQMVKMSHQC